MNYAAVSARLQAIPLQDGLPKTPVTLIAVTKGRSAADVAQLQAAGARDFGENRIAEAALKFAPRPRTDGVRLHLIGPLQSNKTAAAVRLFDVIHTLDRESTALALLALRDKGVDLPQLLVQVNLANEPQKSGVPHAQADAFLQRMQQVHGLPIAGLMCIPPLGVPALPYFTRLRALAHAHGLPELSMGMSDDYEQAAACGSTMVRVGRALFA